MDSGLCFYDTFNGQQFYFAGFAFNTSNYGHYRFTVLYTYSVHICPRHAVSFFLNKTSLPAISFLLNYLISYTKVPASISHTFVPLTPL